MANTKEAVNINGVTEQEQAKYNEWLRSQGLGEVAERINREDAQGWRPEPGDKLVGKVLEVATGGQGSQYGSYPLLTLDTFKGEVAVHCFHTTLRNAVSEVKAGDSIAIEYVGLGKSKSRGTDMEVYRVKVAPKPVFVDTTADGEIPF